MRIGVVCVPGPNAQYRAIDPMQALARRGHEIVWPPESGQAEPQRLTGCDVVHVYRFTGRDLRSLATRLVRAGVGLVYDNDDDYTAVPKESPRYKQTGGFAGQRAFDETVKMAKIAHTFTTTSPALAEKYRQVGVGRTRVIPNTLSPDLARPHVAHRGIVVGWVAGMEHLADVARIPIREALAQLLERHPDVSVVSVGVNLGLAERYEHLPDVDFFDLPRVIGGFDVGIAPLSDIPCNWMRSDIKVKEYAASGVPWLASPIGPYRNLGEAQGGRLVPDDGWLDALARLVTHRRERRKLAKKAQKWAQGQTIDAVAEAWEQVVTEAAAGT